jgi:hypothetical protein
MARWRDEWRRIDAIAAVVHRSCGGPDLARLNNEQRIMYAEWTTLHQKWRQQFSGPDEFYATLIDGGWAGPTLPELIRTALYGEPVHITADNARDVYVRMTS